MTKYVKRISGLAATIFCGIVASLLLAPAAQARIDGPEPTSGGGTASVSTPDVITRVEETLDVWLMLGIAAAVAVAAVALTLTAVHFRSMHVTPTRLA